MHRASVLRHGRRAFAARLMAAASLLAVVSVSAQQIDIAGPCNGIAAVLPNGNIVVTSDTAVYLYTPGGALISTLAGAGGGTVTVLTNGNFVVSIPSWSDGANPSVGAVTWIDGSLGLDGAVSSANSLVGTQAGDGVGSDGITPLNNGNYVVASRYWANGTTASAGAVTWANGSTGLAGPVSTANSLVGTTAGDNVGSGTVYALANGNYVASSPGWSNGGTSAADAGAVTWANGATGLVGEVSAANSLVGTTTGDVVGNLGVTALTNGNYVVASIYWNNGAATQAGAVTWGNGSAGVSGPVSAANSLVGTTTNDIVGLEGVVALSNGNYVVATETWDNGATQDAGAATWADGNTGLSGAVSAANSLVGTSQGDSVGAGGVRALSNGNYVVNSYAWHHGQLGGAGAVTWGNGVTGVSDAVSTANSLVGAKANDFVGGNGVFALTNGNYVVGSFWNNGVQGGNFGAVTWAPGDTGLLGEVSAGNSLVGTGVGDKVGSGGIAALANGNYVAASPNWNGGFGAATWANGSTGLVGSVSPANSLVGGKAGDHTAGPSGANNGGVKALNNGNYVVQSVSWNDGTTSAVGAATWANGSEGLAGPVSAINSLVGTTAGDAIGGDGITALGNGNYIVASRYWDRGAIIDAGAITLGRGTGGTVGHILATNSVRGTTGVSTAFGYDATRDTLVVCQPQSSIISLFKADLLMVTGFE